MTTRGTQRERAVGREAAMRRSKWWSGSYQVPKPAMWYLVASWLVSAGAGWIRWFS